MIGNKARRRGARCQGETGASMTEDASSQRHRFPTTHWSRIVAAGARATPEDREALNELCRAYWYPLYAFIRRKGYDADTAQDLTQSYFIRLLERGILGAADPQRGRFRAFLRTDCGYFLAGERDRQNAQKRGGDRSFLSIDAVDAEGRYRFNRRMEPRPRTYSTGLGPPCCLSA